MYPIRHIVALTALLLTGGTVCALFATGTVARAAGKAGNAARQDQDVSRLIIPLFRGDTGATSNVALGGWGSGEAQSTRDAVFTGGSTSIRVTTHGLYQGARLEFKEPIDLGLAFTSNKTYMRFQVKFSGGDAFQNRFSQSSFQNSRQLVSPFKKMRYLLIMADGTRYELIRPVELPDSDDPDRWVPLAFPLAAIVKEAGGNVPTGDGARVKELAIFGDKYQQFYVGDIRVITDETEISVSSLEEQIIFAQQPVVFSATAEGGATTLVYSWDFDASDGIQEDATGRAVTHTFPQSLDKENDGIKRYVITLTVSDFDGLKKSASTTLEADVTD
ncbi:MAG: PKD domain-containing protein [Capsulimonadales bacterium]|nr:PKD domain-containing protein [Capsulimonadales bacterium]